MKARKALEQPIQQSIIQLQNKAKLLVKNNEFSTNVVHNDNVDSMMKKSLQGKQTGY